MPPAAPRRSPDLVPGIPPSNLGRLRREARDAQVREAHERRLRGLELWVWCFRLRAMVGSDAAVEVLLRLADRHARPRAYPS